MGEGLKLLSQCQNCTQGQYNDVSGVTGCKNCTVGTYGDALRLVSSDVCKKCSTGQYNNELGQINCNHCERGQYNDEYAVTKCKGCHIGRFGNQLGLSSRTNCPLCIIGQFNKKVGKVACQACADGITNKQPGLSDCDYHEEIVKFGGSYSSFGYDNWAQYVVDDAGRTEGLCGDQEGRHQIDTIDRCFNFLSKKSMCDVEAEGDVTRITTGGFAPTGCSVKMNGRTCKAFFKQPDQLGGKCGAGSSDFYTCICKIECPVGTYQNEAGMSGCKNCPTGFYNGELGKSLCFNCPQGKFFSCGFIYFFDICFVYAASLCPDVFHLSFSIKPRSLWG